MLYVFLHHSAATMMVSKPERRLRSYANSLSCNSFLDSTLVNVKAYVLALSSPVTTLLQSQLVIPTPQRHELHRPHLNAAEQVDFQQHSPLLDYRHKQANATSLLHQDMVSESNCLLNFQKAHFFTKSPSQTC